MENLCKSVKSVGQKKNDEVVKSASSANLRDLITCGSGSTTEQVAFRLNSVRNPCSKNVSDNST